MSKVNKWPKVAKTINVISIESDADGTFLANDQMDAIEARLTEPGETEKELTQAKADLAAANKAKDAEAANAKKLADELATANAANKTLTDEVTTLKAKPAGAPSTVKKEKDESGEGNEKPVTGATAAMQREMELRDFDFMTHNLEDGE